MTEVSIATLKAKAVSFPDPVRTLILSEPDQIDLQSYLSKMQTWEKLLKLEAKG